VAEVAGPGERSYLESVWDLRDIFSGLIEVTREYKLTYDLEKQ
jgi:hypothetical protein